MGEKKCPRLSCPLCCCLSFTVFCRLSPAFNHCLRSVCLHYLHCWMRCGPRHCETQWLSPPCLLAPTPPTLAVSPPPRPSLFCVQLPGLLIFLISYRAWALWYSHSHKSGYHKQFPGTKVDWNNAACWGWKVKPVSAVLTVKALFLSRTGRGRSTQALCSTVL